MINLRLTLNAFWQTKSILFPSNSSALLLKHGSFRGLYSTLWVNKKKMYFAPVGGKTNESYFWVSSGKISEALCPTSQNFILFMYFQYSSYSREHLKDFSLFFSIIPPLKNLTFQTLATSASINSNLCVLDSAGCWVLLGCPCTLVCNVPPAWNQAQFQALP